MKKEIQKNSYLLLFCRYKVTILLIIKLLHTILIGLSNLIVYNVWIEVKIF
jgi:hypothetical protein